MGDIFIYLNRMLDKILKRLGLSDILAKSRFDDLDARMLELEKVQLATLKRTNEVFEICTQILAAITFPVAVRGIISVVWEDGRTEEGENVKMRAIMNAMAVATVTYLNKDGGPGKTDGITTWTPSVEGVVTLEPSPDGLSCKITTLPVPTDVALNSVIVTAQVDGDLGDGVQPIVNTLALDVYDPAGNTVSGSITVGEFTPLP
jgi:hypothetical protein